MVIANKTDTAIQNRRERRKSLKTKESQRGGLGKFGDAHAFAVGISQDAEMLL